ncbi:hypothetical protein [Paenirhodobacter populi]|uniref:Uncharacterized protein n=1 Tax=Paenirhodobacter populi TaxID=2306993 RepID=A0A443JEA3_9RHOB|nr:hypothetical protein [Sinirhodobacter populi]RWR18791.1 hypothetical protein D2T30_15630 [Sinirhodobacter populi]
MTGPVVLPDGSPAMDGTLVIFQLRSWDKTDTALVMRGPVIAQVSAGVIDVELFTTSSGSIGTVYDVSYRYSILNPVGPDRAVEQRVGPVAINGAGPYTLADLLPVRLPSDVSKAHRIKRGDTLSLGMQWIDENYHPIDLTGVTITSSLLGPDAAMRTLTVAFVSRPAGTFEVAMPSTQTALLPLGEHQIDIKATVGTVTRRSKTGTIIVERGITQ